LGVSLTLIVFSYSVAIPKKLWTKNYLWLYFLCQKAIGVMLVAMFKLKGANDKFIHTSFNEETPTKKVFNYFMIMEFINKTSYAEKRI
jgi:hypothetical protein